MEELEKVRVVVAVFKRVYLVALVDLDNLICAASNALPVECLEFFLLTESLKFLTALDDVLLLHLFGFLFKVTILPLNSFDLGLEVFDFLLLAHVQAG